jgi:hypothetical protein
MSHHAFPSFHARATASRSALHACAWNAGEGMR